MEKYRNMGLKQTSICTDDGSLCSIMFYHSCSSSDFLSVFHRYFLVPTSFFSIHQIYSEESPVVIFDALAGHLHQVQIRAHDDVNAESQWSEWSPLILVRPWEGKEGNFTVKLQKTKTFFVSIIRNTLGEV